MSSKRYILIAALALAGTASLAQAQAPADKVKRRQADLLYPIGSLVQSSKLNAGNMYIIGVLGPDPFNGRDASGNVVNHLDAAASASNARRATTKRKQIVIRRYKTADDYKPCHMLFVANGQQQAAKRIAETHAETLPVLLVGNGDGLVGAGVPVNFYEVQMSDGSISVRMEFAPAVARGTGFDKINPSLVRLLKRGLGRVVQSQ